MRMMTFAKRCTKEILRDPLNLSFGLGFPLVLLLLLSAIQANIPVSLFEIDMLTPGITVFGLSFMTLFSATLISKDRESALLQSLYTTPLTGFDFIIGYMLPLLRIALGQIIICYLFAIPLGLTVSVNVIYAIIGIIPMAIFLPWFGCLRFWVDCFSGILFDFAASSCHRDPNGKSGLHWDIFIICTCLYCGRHECCLSNGTAAPDGGNFDSWWRFIYQLFGHLSAQRLAGMGRSPILVFSGIFILGYLVVWAIIYSIIKRNTERLNETLKKKQQNKKDF